MRIIFALAALSMAACDLSLAPVRPAGYQHPDFGKYTCVADDGSLYRAHVCK